MMEVRILFIYLFIYLFILKDSMIIYFYFIFIIFKVPFFSSYIRELIYSIVGEFLVAPNMFELEVQSFKLTVEKLSRCTQLFSQPVRKGF